MYLTDQFIEPDPSFGKMRGASKMPAGLLYFASTKVVFNSLQVGVDV